VTATKAAAVTTAAASYGISASQQHNKDHEYN
jgi:hypothetical protein